MDVSAEVTSAGSTSAGVTSAGARSARGEAVRRGWERKKLRQRLGIVERICGRIAAGETLTEVCRDPMFPARGTVTYWAQTEPALEHMLADAQAACPGGRRASHAYSEELAETVMGRVEAGRGLAEVCAEEDMPAVGSVYRWLDERPELAARYRRAKAVQAERLFDLAWRIAREATAEDMAVARLQINTLKWRVAHLAPRRYGTLKVQDPAPELLAANDDGQAAGEAQGAGDGAGKRGKRERVIIEVRGWAVAPGKRVMETTRLRRGLTRVENWRLRRAVEAGRFTEDAEGNLAEVDWRDFDCGPPPPDLVEMDRKDGGHQ